MPMATPDIGQACATPHRLYLYACLDIHTSTGLTVSCRSTPGKAEMSQRDEHHFTAGDQRAIDGVSDVIDVSVINPRSMLPAYLQLAIYLRGAIIIRRLPPGSPLPSEPELSERYEVSRDTVRRAMQLLRDIGIAETRRGVGHFVTRTPEIRRVVVAPGSQVIVRMPQPDEQGELLGLTVFVVTEPGKPAIAYDTAQTLLVFPGEDRSH